MYALCGSSSSVIVSLGWLNSLGECTQYKWLYSLCDSTPLVIVPLGWLNSLGDCTQYRWLHSLSDCTPLTLVLTWWFRRCPSWAWRVGWCSSAPSCCQSRRWSWPACPGSPGIAGPLSTPPQTKTTTTTMIFETRLSIARTGWKNCKLVVSNAPWSCPCRCGLHLFLNSPT